MIRNKKIFNQNIVWILVFSFLLSISTPVTAPAMTIQEERELGDKILEEVKKRWPVVEDSSVNAYATNVGRRILQAAGPQPFEYQFFVLNSSEVNAFAVPGGKVFLNSGLILLVDREDELASVVAHEIGHVTARHISKRSEKATPLSLATLGALLLSIFLGGKAASAIATTTLAAGQTIMLKYSREDEDEADRLGLKYLEQAGYDRRAMITMFKKLRRTYGPASSDPPAYLMSHPAAEARAENIELQIYKSPSELKVSEPVGNLKRVQTKLRTEDRDPAGIVTYFENWVKRQPNEADAYFGLGIAQRQMGALNRAVESFQEASSRSPRDGEILRELGLTYFLQGDFSNSQKYLEEASRSFPNDGMISLHLGRVYFEQKAYQASISSFLIAKELLPTVPEIYYHLGQAYGATDQLGLAYLSFGQYYRILGDWRIATGHFQKALTYYGEADPERQTIQRMLNDLDAAQRAPRKGMGPPRPKD
jgi:beta-barrel assembly-enhancing protease